MAAAGLLRRARIYETDRGATPQSPSAHSLGGIAYLGRNELLYAVFRPPASQQPKGWISRYAWGDDYHNLIKDKLESLLDNIRRICNAPVEGKAFVDSGPVLEREFASIAGVGWIGKNTHLISPQRGSWFFWENFSSAYRSSMIDRFAIGVESAICV